MSKKKIYLLAGTVGLLAIAALSFAVLSNGKLTIEAQLIGKDGAQPLIHCPFYLLDETAIRRNAADGNQLASAIVFSVEQYREHRLPNDKGNNIFDAVGQTRLFSVLCDSLNSCANSLTLAHCGWQS